MLHIAELANPEWVSVPLVGWSHSRALAKLCDVHLITQVRNRPAILRAGLVEGRDFTALDNERLDKAAWKLGLLIRGGENRGLSIATAFSSFTYYAFEHLLWKQFGPAIRNGEYDLVHRLTPLSPATPSLLAGWCKEANIPFILGPLNGGVPWPKQFNEARKREREWLSKVRGAFKLLPGYRSTRENASAILAGSHYTSTELSDYAAKLIYLPENAVDPTRFDISRQGPPSQPLRIAFVGRLVPLKAVDILIEAAAPLIREGKVVLDIIGDGPERETLGQMVAEQKMEAGVTFAGWIQHDQIKKRLAQSDVFGFPSVREFGGGVVLEAMALGLVPVVLDYGGPGELVTKQTGFKIPMRKRSEIIQDFRGVLEKLVEDSSVIRPMGERARERIFKLFTWDARARQTLEVYRWVLGLRPDKPDFGLPLATAPEPSSAENV